MCGTQARLFEVCLDLREFPAEAEAEARALVLSNHASHADMPKRLEHQNSMQSIYFNCMNPIFHRTL